MRRSSLNPASSTVPEPAAPYVPALGRRWLTPLYDPVMRWTMREETFKRALLAQAGIAPRLGSWTSAAELQRSQHALREAYRAPS